MVGNRFIKATEDKEYCLIKVSRNFRDFSFQEFIYLSELYTRGSDQGKVHRLLLLVSLLLLCFPNDKDRKWSL